jgi:hypothetical protein
MQQHIQTLVKQFFHKNSLQEVTVQELEQFASEFPYAAVGQYLFAKKLQHHEENGHAGQKEKTTLYFHNPMWCRWLLEDHAEPGKLPATSQKVVVEDPPPPPSWTPPVKPVQELPQEQVVQPQAEPVAAAENIPDSEPSTPDTLDELVFEAYHTIDYFASQGIKLQSEDYSKDRLGQQLKSFTEWLRSMKRVQDTGAPAVTLDDIANKSIQQIAELSIEEKEVVTETMAQVWAKQGNKEKAIAIYEKLSLLNPAKNAYFAAKIDQLKAS